MATASNRFDVVVIGGGLAGSCTAARLAKRGIRVALVEQHHHPRYAVGESILPQAWRYLDDLGVTAEVEREGFAVKKGVTSMWGDVLREFEFNWFGFDRDPLLVDRWRFDEILFRRAETLGASVFEGAKTTSVDRLNDLNVVHIHSADTFSLLCPIVVDATGQAGLVSRALGSRNGDLEGRNDIFLWGYFTGGKYVAPGGFLGTRDEKPGQIVMANSYMCETGDGWALQLPLRTSSFVGFSTSVENIPESSNEDLERYFLERLSAFPNFNKLLSAAAYVPNSFRYLRDFSFRAESLCGPGYFLVGDAAAYTDPIFAHGAQFAIYSAFSAAGAIERTLKGRGTEAGKLYSMQVSQHYEMSRAMARGDKGSSPLAASTIASLLGGMPPGEIDLLCTAASIAGRSNHFSWMSSVSGTRARANFRELADLV